MVKISEITEVRPGARTPMPRSRCRLPFRNTNWEASRSTSEMTAGVATDQRAFMAAAHRRPETMLPNRHDWLNPVLSCVMFSNSNQSSS